MIYKARRRRPGRRLWGERLKIARTAKSLTLRGVEAQTEISNGDPSQLESGVVKAPSPQHLFQLAALYGVDYAELFQLAGYPLPGTVAYQASVNGAGRHDSESPPISFASGYLTAEEQGQVRQYVEDLLAARRGRE